MKKHIMIISPPFYSHYMPLLALGKSFQRQGADVTMACNIDFKQSIIENGLAFYELDINANKNTGKVKVNEQPTEEQDRLEAFFEATKKGAVETLILQTQHRKQDMFYCPESIMKQIELADHDHHVDTFVVDILSYSVTLALYILDKSFITFCPPHPATIPNDEALYGLPVHWPAVIRKNRAKLKQLEKLAMNTQLEFRHLFNEKIIESGAGKPLIDNPFSLVSDQAVIYNYLDFKPIKERPSHHKSYYIGHAFEEEELESEWKEKLDPSRRKIMITLGTFLSSREDVMRRLIVGAKKFDVNAQLFVSAGKHEAELKHYGGQGDFIEHFLPQRALMPYMDIVIHHGGNNTFTEALYHEVPMIILPFSSDQFNVSYDAEREHIATILDPNHFGEDQLIEALRDLRPSADLQKYAKISKERGPDYATSDLFKVI